MGASQLGFMHMLVCRQEVFMYFSVFENTGQSVKCQTTAVEVLYRHMYLFIIL